MRETGSGTTPAFGSSIVIGTGEATGSGSVPMGSGFVSLSGSLWYSGAESGAAIVFTSIGSGLGILLVGISYLLFRHVRLVLRRFTPILFNPVYYQLRVTGNVSPVIGAEWVAAYDASLFGRYHVQ